MKRAKVIGPAREISSRIDSTRRGSPGSSVGGLANCVRTGSARTLRRRICLVQTRLAVAGGRGWLRLRRGAHVAALVCGAGDDGLRSVTEQQRATARVGVDLDRGARRKTPFEQRPRERVLDQPLDRA